MISPQPDDEEIYTMKRSLLITLTVCVAISGFSQLANPDSWVPDARVRHMTHGDGKIFSQGDFRWVGEPYGGAGPVLNLDLSHDATFPLTNFRVEGAIPDDAGGWYTYADGFVGHIKADKTTEILPITITGSSINDIAKSGNILYIVGQFGTVNGTPRNHVAAVDLTTNTVTAWNPGSNGTVYSVALFGGTVYIGGSFSVIGGLTRHKIAAIDAATGATTTWNANVVSSFGYVFDIVPTATSVYFGGSFSNVASGSPSRTNFAAVNATTGALLSFNPRPNDWVLDLLLDGTTLYISGEYTQIASVARYGLTAFDTGTGSLLSFNPIFPDTYGGPVNAMAIDGTNLYVGGDFLSVNGTDQAKIAVLNKTTGASVSTVQRNFSDEVYAISIVGTKVLVGCYYLLGITGESNTRSLIALDETTGHGVGWVPQLPSFYDGWYTRDIHFQNDRLYYWQSFDTPPYETVIGALDSDDGSIDPTFNVDITGTVTAWAFASNTLYVAGNFTHVNGIAQSRFAAINLTTGSLLPFAISTSSIGGAYISSMAVSNNVLYVSGDYQFTDGGIMRTQLAAWDATTGTLLPWAPQFPGPVGSYDIGAIHNGKVYIIGSIVRRVNAITGAVDAWIPDGDASEGAGSIAVHGNYVYIAGGFSPGLIRVGIVSGSRTPWQPSVDDVEDSEGSINTLLVEGNKLYVGGNFSFPRPDDSGQYFAMFDLPAEVANEPPQILSNTSATPASGAVSIDLTTLISDPDDNLDLTTLSLLSDISELGAAASLDVSHLLTLDYGEKTPPAADSISVEVCDLLEACTQQMIVIELGGADLVVYNAVSPNNDGKNDVLILENIGINNKVIIFDRWGATVFSAENYDNLTQCFRGLNGSGDMLPNGTYYYRIDFTDGRPARTGYLVLRK